MSTTSKAQKEKLELLQTKTYTRLYEHSLEYISYSFLTKLGIRNISPKTLKNFFAAYGFPLLMSVAVFVPSNLLKTYPDKTIVYLTYLALVALSARIGRIYGGIFMMALLSIKAVFLFKPFDFSFSWVSFDPLSQLIVFILTAVVATLLIDSSLRTKEVERLKSREKDYGQALVELHTDFVKAQADIKARDEFLSIASHELKTPLTAMLLRLHDMVNSIRNKSLAHFSIPKLIKVLQSAEQQIKLLASMINDLLNVSLITTGQMNLEYVEGDLVKLTKRVVQNFSEVLKQKKYKIKIEYTAPVVGNWDEARLAQAISNLISNAIKYGKEKPILIRVHHSGNTAKLAIQDQGIGIESKDQKVLFDRFKRVADPKYQKGLGVGLYVTEQIVKAHGGSIKVSSSLQKGSTFTIELPLNNS